MLPVSLLFIIPLYKNLANFFAYFFAILSVKFLQGYSCFLVSDFYYFPERDSAVLFIHLPISEFLRHQLQRCPSLDYASLVVFKIPKSKFEKNL